MNQHAAIRAADHARPRFTNQDFRRMVEVGAFDDMRAELVEGEIVKVSPAGPGHGVSNGSLLLRIASALSDADGRIAIDVMVEVEEGTIRAPDVVLLRERWTGIPRITGRDVDLAVEISDTTLGVDLGDKPDDYARAGVPIYWVIDLKVRAVHVFSDESGGVYTERKLVAFHEPLQVPGTDQTIILT